MAKISDKDLKELESWNIKELRKLKINAKNRIEKLKSKPNHELNEKHILFGKESGELNQLLLEIGRVEKKLANS